MLLEAGQRAKAEAIGAELAEVLPTVRASIAASKHYLPVVLTALGRAGQLLPWLETASQTPWVKAARSYAAENFAEAADRYAQLEDRVAEAHARLRAAERLIADGRTAAGEEQLRKALAFYRSVGATTYIREAERLLAESA
jgi:hypothetical protein